MDLNSLFTAILGDPAARAGASGVLAFSLVEILKRTLVPDWRFWQLIALLSAVVVNVAAEVQSTDNQFIRAVLFGLIGGLIASGLYEFAKSSIRGGKAMRSGTGS